MLTEGDYVVVDGYDGFYVVVDVDGKAMKLKPSDKWAETYWMTWFAHYHAVVPTFAGWVRK